MKVFIRQSVNAYIRRWNDLVYIENQVNHVSRSYEGWRGELVSRLNRYPQELDVFVHEGMQNGNEVGEFIEELKRLWFIVAGESEEELNNNEHNFSYLNKQSVERLFRDDYHSVQVDTPDNPWLKSIQIEITSLCNERCLHCYIPGENKLHRHMMSTEDAIKIIDQFVEMQGLRIIFSGGEPFLHRDIFKILQYSREKDLMIFIQSNISTINDGDILALQKLNVFNIQVSLYSTDECVHDLITGVKGSWKRTKCNLEKMVANHIPVMISCPMMKQNYRGYAELQKYARSLGIFCYIDYVLLAQHNFCTGNLETRLSLEETESLIEQVLDNDEVFKSKIASLNSLDDLGTVPFAQRFLKCAIMRNSVCVAVNGSVYPCPAWQGMVVGDVLNRPLSSIWLDNEIVTGLRNLDKDSFLKCRQCNLKNYCDMCVVYNYNENRGDMFQVCNRFCETAALLRKKIAQRFLYNKKMIQ